VIRNNVFGPGGCSDGIQAIGNADGIQVLYNEFVGIKQGSCSPVHADPIQFYGADNLVLTGNYFHGNSTGVMNAGCASQNGLYTDNVFISDGEYLDQIVMTGTNAGTYTNNTLVNSSIRFLSNGCGFATNAVLRNNIIRQGLNLDAGQTTSSFTMSNNNGISQGTNNISGTPTFVGGSTPSTWAGFQLSAASVGRNAGSDGTDIGTHYFGAATTGSPSSPSNLHIVP